MRLSDLLPPTAYSFRRHIALLRSISLQTLRRPVSPRPPSPRPPRLPVPVSRHSLGPARIPLVRSGEHARFLN